MLQPPHGFERHTRTSAVTAPWEPIYALELVDRVKLGLFIDNPHCNSRGFIHGGVIATLCDNAMGLSCGKVIVEAGGGQPGIVTINLSIDYVGAAKNGQWLEIDTDFVKTGRTICFARGRVLADEKVVAMASGTFKQLG
ncbi:MAG: PaaI family thioesterase [Pseudomonadota bacterium]